MKTKIKGDSNIDFAKNLQLVLDHPGNSLCKSSISLIESIILSLKINIVPDREDEMREMLEDLIGYEDRCRAKGDPAIGDGWYNKAKKLLNELNNNQNK